MIGVFYDDCDQRRAMRRQMIEDQRADEARREADSLAAIDAEIAGIMLTTEDSSGLEIIERIEIITAECAYGLHLFEDLFLGVRDVVGGRSKTVQDAMRDARRTALMELKKEASEVGANAVVGVDLDYVELSVGGTMVMQVASGTSVRARLN